jgi:hypothetical protein
VEVGYPDTNVEEYLITLCPVNLLLIRDIALQGAVGHVLKYHAKAFQLQEQEFDNPTVL